MKILSIETSCDETAVAIVELTGNLQDPAFSVLGQAPTPLLPRVSKNNTAQGALSIKVWGQALYSQVREHAEFGGVYPNLAKRLHGQNLVPLTLKALKESDFALSPPTTYNLQPIASILEREKELLEQLQNTPELHHNPGVDAIAVTRGPGLEPALWVGINFAKALSHLWQVPLVPVNHMEGHIFSVLADRKNSKFEIRNSKMFPAIALLVSGGHTELVLLKDWFEYEILGRTLDDAVGEAFDKVARLLELPYPGGPEISRLAQLARNKSQILSTKSQINSKSQIQNQNDSNYVLRSTFYTLPRPMLNSGDYNFSYSGLKTATRRIVDERPLTDEEKQELAREFEDAALDVLLHKTEKALQEYTPQTLIVAGGVIANTELRRRLNELVARYNGIHLALPSPELATDNAIMIGIAGALHFHHTPEAFSIFDPSQDIRADGNWRVDRR